MHNTGNDAETNYANTLPARLAATHLPSRGGLTAAPRNDQLRQYRSSGSRYRNTPQNFENRRKNSTNSGADPPGNFGIGPLLRSNFGNDLNKLHGHMTLWDNYMNPIFEQIDNLLSLRLQKSSKNPVFPCKPKRNRQKSPDRHDFLMIRQLTLRLSFATLLVQPKQKGKEVTR